MYEETAYLGNNMDTVNIIKDTRIGKKFEIDERTFYPVVEVSTFEGESSFAESITPIAMVVVEPSKNYIITLGLDELDYEKISELFISHQNK